MATIEKHQITRIKILQKELGMTDDEYRGMLSQSFNKTSCTDLSKEQAADLIVSMWHLTRKPEGARFAPRSVEFSRKKYDELKGRPNYLASPAQMRLIEVLWSQVSRAQSGEAKAKALNSFLGRYGVRNLLWLPKSKVQMAVKAIEVMREAKFKEQHAQATVAA